MNYLLRPIFMNDDYWKLMPQDNIRVVEDPQNDSFIRVIGSGNSNSNIQYGKELGIITTSILEDGGYGLCYDVDTGIRLLYSMDCGVTWAGSSVIFARNCRAGLVLGRYVFYIGSSGIGVKHANISDFSIDKKISYDKKAGNNVTTREIELQQSLDSRTNIYIGSGDVDLQRLSGYITPDGIIKVFFYKNGIPECIQSIDSFKWKISENF